MIVRGQDPWAADADRLTADGTPQKEENDDFPETSCFRQTRKLSDIEAGGEGKLALTPRAEIRNIEFRDETVGGKTASSGRISSEVFGNS